ncbi:transporter [Vitiosangium sp. GDMCC 1.1324]|uniref:transporter n=1 Tax=Vitiosangium sp. (strain GDMCC 1.1324) TaxID=2138576 RepID=UPI000D36AEC6|nr:transporter [Vitiosangium sp. GDMCC 1.1324]PTL80887.1 hypothetical protein DAT35_26510 [Vitiosangium sp. GDMCC 1.1324]
MWKSCIIVPLLVAAFLTPREGLACATCACGDPTLTSMGTEQPFAGRLRFAAQMRAWGLTTGQESVDAVALRELRMDLSVAYAPLPWLFLSATLPLQARTVRDVSLARETSWGLGDMEVGAKVFVFRDREFSPDHLLGVFVGARLPTSPTVSDRDGRPLSLDAQLGTGSVDPILGLSYSTFRADWSFVASATGYLPTRGREGFRAGASLRSTLAAQYQPNPRWALRLAVDGRLEGPSDTLGIQDPEGSGFIAYASPDVLFSPATDVVVELGVRVPVLKLLRGHVQQTPILQASVAYDL